jgi:sulfite exporter TauE/SafE
VFDFNQPLLIAGLLLGLASSLHCLGMCSGIASSLCLTASTGPGRPVPNIYWASFLLNVGRVSGYILAGAVVGGIGSSVFGVLDRSIAYVVLRWAAAVSLMWIGLFTADFLPLPVSFYRVGQAISGKVAVISQNPRLGSTFRLFVTGCAWGFLPCAMVYGALFYAMLSDSWLNGAVTMLGFGLGTLVPITAVGVGFPLLLQNTHSKRLRTTLGIAIIFFAIGSVLVPATNIAHWCGFGS